MATTNELEKAAIPTEIVEYEIEYPRCYGIMCLCSETETLVYACGRLRFHTPHTVRNEGLRIPAESYKKLV